MGREELCGRSHRKEELITIITSPTCLPKCFKDMLLLVRITAIHT